MKILSLTNQGGYSTTSPLPFQKNPLSLFGDLVGFAAWLGVLVQQLQQYLVSEHAVPVPVLLVGAIAALLAAAILCACITVQFMSCCDRSHKDHQD